MNQKTRIGLSLLLLISFCVTPALSQEAAQEDPGQPARLEAPALDPAQPSQPTRKRVSGRLQKREMAELENAPGLAEIQKLKWEAGSGENTQKISLDKVFERALEHNLDVRQAEAQIQAAEAQAKDAGALNIFNLLNPIDSAAWKKAADSNVLAARTHLQAVRQKALLESARMQADLMQAFLNKYLAFQSIEQGKSQLKAEQQRFIAGETNRFDVTQTQMALIDRYGKYLSADNLYHAASVRLASRIQTDPEDTLIPEGFTLQDDNAAVQPLGLVPEDLSVDKVQKAARFRPEIRELAFKREGLVQLVKAASGPDKQKKEAELRQLELEIEKAEEMARVLAEKAFSDFRLAEKNLDLARQRHELASQFVRQLQVSHQAGFSSAKDVLEGQIELARTKTNLIGAQVSHNLSQIQLVYEMGLLTEDSPSRPLEIPAGSL